MYQVRDSYFSLYRGIRELILRQQYLCSEWEKNKIQWVIQVGFRKGIQTWIFCASHPSGSRLANVHLENM